MGKLLHIESCPQAGAPSASSVAKAFLDVYREAHPLDSIEVMNLWKIYFPAAIGEAMAARYAERRNNSRISELAAAWHMIETYAEHFKSADKYLLSIPTWSFGVPYVLKEYIDVITQPGLLFEPSAKEGFLGLVPNRPVCVVYAKGGSVGPGSKREALRLQVSFMEEWLRLIGLTEVYRVIDVLADGRPADFKRGRKKAVEEAVRIARSF